MKNCTQIPIIVSDWTTTAGQRTVV